jgi:hypothetical protein
LMVWWDPFRGWFGSLFFCALTLVVRAVS